MACELDKDYGCGLKKTGRVRHCKQEQTHAVREQRNSEEIALIKECRIKNKKKE